MVNFGDVVNIQNVNTLENKKQPLKFDFKAL